MGHLDIVIGGVTLVGLGLLVADAFGNFLEDGGKWETGIMAVTAGGAGYCAARMVF